MDNFDLTKYLAEGKLHEFTDAISPEEVRDMAQMVADAFTAEDAEGDRFSTYMVYKVGNVDGMSFELDTEATEQTPEDDAKYGTGEGWGGMFRVKPTDNGYEIRNSEKGGLVATMDGSGFTMLDAEQSKSEMGGDTDYMERRKETDDYMEEGEMLNEGMLDTIKDKMVSMGKKLLSKFSPEEQASMKAAAEKVLGPNYSKEDITLDKAKEIGKIISGGLDEPQELDENLRKKIGAALLGIGLPTAFIAGHGFGGTDAGAITAGIGTAAALIGMVMVNVDESKEIKSNKMKKSELKEMIKAAMSENARTDAEEEGYLDGMRDEKEDMKEAEDVEVEDNEDIDVDIEKDIEVDDESSEVDVDIKASMPGESEDVEEVQALLMKAQEAAEALGDDKLQDQIGNTITYFTRAHVAGNVSEMDLDIDGASDAELPEMEAELGLEEAKDEEVKENLNESVMFPMWNKIK